ncbi:MAG: EAL domain-containing protein, partial [Clostridia bacterium]|nr:EAL domain-containing protein [Clostridia bacterium]
KMGLWAIPFVVSQFITLFSLWSDNVVLYIDETGYHSGPLYNLIYITFIIYLILSIVVIIINAKQLNRSELVGVISYWVVLAVGNVIRFLQPQVLIMSFFYLISVIILYLIFQNPTKYVDSRGAFNMVAFRTRLKELIGEKPYRIIVLVIQNYNDARGIYGGIKMDQAITLINQYLSKEFRKQTLFYLRGGKFALLGDESLEWESARKTISKRFDQPWHTTLGDLDFSLAFVQIGSESKINDLDRVMNNLLIAFDQAGQMGNNAVIELNSTNEINRQLDIKRSLEEALEQNSVEIFLQPLIDASTHSLVCAEVLALIRDDKGRIIPPGLFIPIAERNGWINLMGEQIFEKTCRFMYENDPGKLGISWINVNLSPIQCMCKDLRERFSSILAQYGIAADVFHLEITEQSMIDYSLLRAQIEALEECGFRFVLDDYGSGYSNLTRVKQCPFINIKLDMELVWSYINQEDPLLPTIVQAFKQMNFSVTAEGIETEEMAKTMHDIGCDYLQGYYFSKPLPVNEFIQKYGTKQ